MYSVFTSALWAQSAIVQWLPTVQDVCAAAGRCGPATVITLFYSILIGVVLFFGAILYYPDIRSSTESQDLDPAELSQEFPQPNPDDGADAEPEVETTDDEPLLDDLSSLHQQTVAPSGIQPEYRQIRSGKKYRQVMLATEFPDQLDQGALRTVFTRPDLSFDLSIHIKPKNRERAKRHAEQRAESLNADADIFGNSNAGGGGFTAGDRRAEAKRTGEVRNAIKNGQQPAAVSMYIAVRGESEEELQEQARNVRKTFSDSPSNIGLSTIAGKQDCALQSTSPIGMDVLADEPEMDPESILLGRGIGCLVGSMTKSTVIEDTGIELGEHAINGTPVIKDMFESETNYNEVVIGDSGSGKSLSEKKRVVDTKAAKEDTMVVFLDPLNGFEGVSRALDAKHITIGGTRGLNPLEIRKPPAESQETLEEAGDQDPLSAKIRDVMSFFQNFAHQQGVELGDATPLLHTAVKNSYESAGITHDITTHGKASPTVLDVLDILEDMAENPGDHIIRTEHETEQIRQEATKLTNYMRPFVEGQYQNLAESSDFDLRDEDVVYLDLSQQEGSGTGAGLMMQLMFSLVYERAKETPKNVIFVIDEFRFIMRDVENLEFLGQRVRHSRHFDTSIRFLTQNIRDFFAHDEAESIINNSFINVIHRTKEIEDWREKFGLNDQQVKFIEEAKTGDDGYSEALVGINGEWYPIQVFANPGKLSVIDFDPRDNELANLPGIGPSDSEILAQELQNELRARSANHSSLPIAVQETLAELPEEQRDKLQLLGRESLIEAVREIRDGTEVERAANAALATTLQELHPSTNQGAESLSTADEGTRGTADD